MSQNKLLSGIPWRVALIFMLLTTGLFIVSRISFISQEENHFTEQKDKSREIALLKVNQNKEEIMRPVSRFLKHNLLVGALLILINTILFILWLWDQRLKLARIELKDEIERKALKDHFRYLFIYANDIIILTDSSFKIVEINEKALQSYNYTREELIARNSSILIAPESINDDTYYKKILLEEGSSFYETRHINKFGTEFHVEISTRVIEIEGSRFFQSIGRDITERKLAEEEIINLNTKLEQRVIHRTAQLEALNKDLESFSYSVSHDLRAPLRTLNYFSNALIEDYGQLLDEEGKRICTVISSSGARMSQLIDDLLRFSKIGRGSMELMVLDIESMACKVFSEISTENEKLNISLSIRKSEKAVGDPKLIRIVLNNLISNALKYSSKQPNPEIEIGSSSQNGRIVYYIRDNGIGFDMQYRNKIFEVFQRLHSENEFDGNGIGLAIVQRIIQKHNGKVWAEGEPGKGATFYFSLQATKESDSSVTEVNYEDPLAEHSAS